MKAAGLLMLTLAAALACPAARANEVKLSPERQRSILRSGLNAFDEGIAVTRDDRAKAQTRFREAAAAFESLIDAGLDNAPLRYNLGNTYYRLGDLGRSILNYRGAARLAPRDRRLANNLGRVREQVSPFIAPAGQSQLMRNLLFWHFATSPTERLAAAVVYSVLGWVLLALCLRRRHTGLALVGLLCIAAGLACAASVAWQLSDESDHPPAVIVAGEHVLRLGRGDGYDPALAQPLGPGVELRIMSQRGDWIEVELVSGQTGWIPSTGVEKVN